MKINKKTLPLKILSVIIAIFVWYYVLTIGDPINTKMISGISVQMTDPNYFNKLGKVYTVKNDSNIISVRITDRRSITDNLSAKDFIATADLSKWSESLGNIPINVVCTNNKVSPSNFVQSSYTMQIEVDNKAEKTFPIKVNAVGHPATGLSIKSMIANPESVTVSGPEKVINSISSIQAYVNVTGTRKGFVAQSELMALGKDGNEINADSFRYTSLKDNKISCQVKLTHTNNIPIKVLTQGNLPEGYSLGDIICEPNTISISSNIATGIDRLKQITITSPELDLDGKTSNFTVDIDLRRFLPNDIEISPDSPINAKVTVNINKNNFKKFSLPLNMIKIEGVPNGVTANISMPYKKLPITVLGPVEELDDLSIFDLAPFVSLNAVSEDKTYYLPLQLGIGEPYSLKDKVYIQIKLSNSDRTDNQEQTDKKSDSTDGNDKTQHKPNKQDNSQPELNDFTHNSGNTQDADPKNNDNQDKSNQGNDSVKTDKEDSNEQAPKANLR